MESKARFFLWLNWAVIQTPVGWWLFNPQLVGVDQYEQ